MLLVAHLFNTFVCRHAPLCVRACLCVCACALCLSNYFRIPSKTNVCCSPSVEDEGRQTLRETISDGIHAHTHAYVLYTPNVSFRYCTMQHLHAAEGIRNGIRNNDTLTSHLLSN